MFITTTLPYCNGPMHVGAAFEFVLADAINRFFKQNGKDSFLNIGLDQTGAKILAKSKELGIPVDDYIRNISIEWKDSCNKLNIDYDNFYETYSEEHIDNVKITWDYFINNGDIYEKEYTGKYCIGCESFKLEKDLVDGICTDHINGEIQCVSETNFFFNLGKYKKHLTTWLKSNPISKSDENELVKYISDYDDFSISRKKTEHTFDIVVPDRDDQVIGVWFSALLNYIYACDDWDNSYSIQLCGKDNLRFQCQIFQCFLSSLGKKNTDKILVHGIILDKYGKKMSKSMGNVIDPVNQVEKYGIEAFRYYLLGGLSTFGNTNWDEEAIVKLYNSHLANDYGNLITRTLHLIDTKGVVVTGPESDYKDKVDTLLSEANESIEDNFNIHDYCTKLNEVVSSGNQYINVKEPWKTDDYSVTLNNLYYLLTQVTEYYYPIIPGKVDQIRTALNNLKKEILFEKI